MSMSCHIKQQAVQGFCPRRYHFPETWQNWILLFSRSRRSSKHFKKMFGLLCRCDVAHCFKLLQSEQYRRIPTTVGNRGSNPVEVNHFKFFFLLGPHVLTLFLFSIRDILYFTWLTSSDSFDLMLL